MSSVQDVLDVSFDGDIANVTRSKTQGLVGVTTPIKNELLKMKITYLKNKSDSNNKMDELKDKVKVLEAELSELKKIPKHGDTCMFRELVSKGTDYEILQATPEQLAEVMELAKKAQEYQINNNNNVFHDKNGNPRKRFNECGNDMENVLKVSTGVRGFSQSVGYPDLQTDDYYLECKIAGTSNIETTMRSFYISTLTKITRSVPHILVCFIHNGGELDMNREPKVIDLYDLTLSLKCEWFSTNHDMYSGN
jgi:hypothetical protein